MALGVSPSNRQRPGSPEVAVIRRSFDARVYGTATQANDPCAAELRGSII
jgi:hypothetical protein